MVISGGGSKGAYGGGIASYLLEHRPAYDLFIGTSTGSLLAPLLAVGKVDILREAYTHVTQDDIFNVNPFISISKAYGSEIKMNHLNTLRQFWRNRKTFGESHNLRDYIKKFYLPEDHRKLREQLINVVVTVSNLSKNQVEYKSVFDHSYEDFVDWIWISCNLIPFMSLVIKDRCEYADGGLGNFIPVKKAIDMGAKHVDAIVLDTHHQAINHLPSLNLFDLIFRIFDYSIYQIQQKDIELADLQASIYEGDINYYYIPQLLTSNSLIFNTEKMKRWWLQGYDYARSAPPRKGQKV